MPFANVVLRVERDGVAGWGEASPNPFYQEDAPSVERAIRRAAEWLRSVDVCSITDVARAWEEVWAVVSPSRAAQCAIDLALWDWLAQSKGVSVAELAAGVAPCSVTSFATIGLSTAEELEEKVEALRGFPRIKIKSDAQADFGVVERVREALPEAEIAVDANCAWTAESLWEFARRSADAGVLFIEQPFAPGDAGQLRRGEWPVPIIADESCVVEGDVAALADRFDGVNVKLVKCGGLTPALRMLRQARALGMKTMVGCMLETSVLISAGCAAAQIADYADLDGAWLIENDPYTRWRFDRGVLRPPA